MTKITLFGAVAAIALSSAGLVHAQEATTSSALLPELIVTAERRESNIQDVPAAVSAFSSQMLERANVTTTRDLTRITPGLNVAQSSFVTQPTIRGVGSRSTAPGDESNVAVYVDGVYQTDMYALNLDLDNIERVEVLKGPQGTLFGRNATGGAINVILAKPSFTPTGKIAASYGSFNTRRVSGRLSGPITDSIAADISGYAMREGRYIRHIVLGRDVGGRDALSVRGALLFKPQDGAFSLQAAAGYSNRNSETGTLAQPFRGNSRLLTNNPGTPLSSKPWETAVTFIPSNKVLQANGDVRASYDFGPVLVNFISSYTDNSIKLWIDNDFGRPDNANTFANFSSQAYIQDLQFSSQGTGRFKWLAGANLFNNKSKANPVRSFTSSFTTLPLTPVPTPVQTNTSSTVTARTLTFVYTTQHAEAKSVYAEGVFEVVDNLFLTAGARYTKETHDYWAVQIAPAVGGRASKSFKNTSPHVSLRYEINDTTNVYGSFSKGFKSGLFNGNAASNTPILLAVNPEKITAYEIGFKTDLSRTLRVNASAFKYDYTDLQVQASNSSTQLLLLNAATAKIKGIDFETLWAPTPSRGIL